MEFRILGPFEVCAGEHALPLGGVKQRAVLTILLLHGNKVVSRDRLIDELWAEEPPKSAATTLRVYISQLRKALGTDVLLTRPPGYLLRVASGQLDLDRFERLFEEARQALAEGAADMAAKKVREALVLWRGPPLGDFAGELFAQAAIVRLEELRLAALELRVEADLALGRHAELVGELEALVAECPLRERLRGQLMLAFYRSGRQAEALAAYQKARRMLVEELGIEPSPALQALERAILVQEPGLAPAAAPEVHAAQRLLLVVPQQDEALDALLALAEPLARNPPRELILARLASDERDLAEATRQLHARRERLIVQGQPTRAAVFTSSQTGADIVRLASEQDADLLLVDAPLASLERAPLPTELAVVLAGAPCDVAVLVLRGSRPPVLDSRGPVLVPFGGIEHDWAAVELAAWLADTLGVPLKLLGTGVVGGRRDATRLLARASLIVQQVAGVAAEPVLVPPGEQGMVESSAEGGLLVVGLPSRWRHEGLGRARLAVARRARPPMLLVRRGLRPGGLAPPETFTRFTWTLAGASA